MSDWSGKSRGSVLGYKIFIITLRYFPIRIAYFIVWFVAAYYYFFTDKKDIRYFYNRIMGYKGLRTERSIFGNYLVFGKTIIDKVAIFSGHHNKFTYDFEGENHLHEMAYAGKGGIVLGAHAGNWEIAGHLLQRLNKPVHILIYDGEQSNIKNLMEEITGNKSFKIIPVKDNDLSHIYAINDVLKKGEIIAMHGDRFRPDSKTHPCLFLGQEAHFPLGPYFLASQFNVPLCIVSTMKESDSHYHFFSTPPMRVEVADRRNKQQIIKNMAEVYASELELMIKKYPLQWFNYYNFWKTK